jgi:hypothetical protein
MTGELLTQALLLARPDDLVPANQGVVIMSRMLHLLAASLIAVAATAAQAPTALAADTETKVCQVIDVTAFADRVHIHCAVPPGQAGLIPVPAYFAVEATNPLADKMAALGAQALQNGRGLSITFVMNPASNPPGCAVADCRRATVISLR